MLKLKDLLDGTQGIILSEYPKFSMPIKRVEEHIIGGRDGSLHVDLESYENIEITLIGHINGITRSEAHAYLDASTLYLDEKKYVNVVLTSLDVDEIIEGELYSFSAVYSADPLAIESVNITDTITKKSDTEVSFTKQRKSKILLILREGSPAVIYAPRKIATIKKTPIWINTNTYSISSQRDKYNWSDYVEGDIWAIDGATTITIKSQSPIKVSVTEYRKSVI